LDTLQETFGPLGEIAEIFLFEPRPEGFIIFHGSLQIPNFDGILSPQHSLIMIKNPNHSSSPIRSTAAPHYPTRRPAIGTLVTLSFLNLQEISTRICPKAVLLADRDVALFFNEFERPIQVTIIQKGSPRFYETVRMVQILQAQLSPRMKVQDIAGHRLFTANMLPSDTAKLRDETQLGQTSKSITNWGPKLTWNTSPDTRVDTAKNQGRPPERLTALGSNSQTGVDHVETMKWLGGRPRLL